MKNLILSSLFLSFFMSGCLKDSCIESQLYTLYTPVYKMPEELRNGVGMEAPRLLSEPGKIYVYGNLLLINEIEKGIHLINNTDPTQPVNIGFLAIPGNRDMAMRNNTLYADNYMDLLAFDFSDPGAPQLTSRIENVFNMFRMTPKGVVVDYIETDTQVEVPCNSGDIFWFDSFDAAVSSSGSGSTPVLQALGIGGSTARFAILQDHLYAVDEKTLHVFDLTQPGDLVKAGDQLISWNIETIWPYEDKLFIGSMNGMYIYDCSHPEAPVQLSAFQHARACDPVVTDGRYAYVTLRSGTFCDGYANQLDVVDIQNLTSPVLLHTYSLSHPIGLTVKGDILYICDDLDGLKVYDKSNVGAIDSHQLSHLTGFQAVDIIALPYNDLLLVVGPEGLVQYNAADPENLQFVSLIAVQ